MREFELSIGDAIRIGDCTITLVDLDGGEAAFRVDDADGMIEADCGESFSSSK